mmetsp:Transcript_30076/g.64231  ORF Transcript_30076/g.64231 Transcript_30076/m.64231 type:complete len:1116 (-) Transcript_30076:97-3444(-)
MFTKGGTNSFCLILLDPLADGGLVFGEPGLVGADAFFDLVEGFHWNPLGVLVVEDLKLFQPRVIAESAADATHQPRQARGLDVCAPVHLGVERLEVLLEEGPRHGAAQLAGARHARHKGPHVHALDRRGHHQRQRPLDQRLRVHRPERQHQLLLLIRINRLSVLCEDLAVSGVAALCGGLEDAVAQVGVHRHPVGEALLRKVGHASIAVAHAQGKERAHEQAVLEAPLDLPPARAPQRRNEAVVRNGGAHPLAHERLHRVVAAAAAAAALKLGHEGVEDIRHIVPSLVVAGEVGARQAGGCDRPLAPRQRQVQEGSHFELPRLHQRIGIIQEHRGVHARELATLDACPEPGPHLLRVVDAVEPALAGVDHHIVLSRGDGNFRAGAGVQNARPDALLASPLALLGDVSEGNPPFGIWVGVAAGLSVGAGSEKGHLGQSEGRQVGSRLPGERDQRVVGPRDPLPHALDQIHAVHGRGILRHRTPKLRRLCVLVLVLAQVGPQAGHERIHGEQVIRLDGLALRHVAPEHSDHRRPLVIGDGVEEPVDLNPAQRFLVRNMKRVRGRERVRHERVLQRQDRKELVRAVLGLGHARANVLNVLCKALVEEEVVPPFHGDEVAEPHVRELVGDGGGGPHHVAVARILGTDQQARLPVGDQPPVLHGPGLETWNRDKVQLLQRKGDAEELLVGRQDLHAALECVREVVGVLWGAPHAHFNPPTVHVARLGHQISDHPSHQVGAHRGRHLEDVLIQDRPALQLPPRVTAILERGVEKHLEVVIAVVHVTGVARHSDGHVEVGLHVGLVEAGEGSPRVRRLHLRRGQHVLLALRVLVVAPVKPTHGLRQGIGVGERDVVEPARVDRLLELDDELLGVLDVPAALLPRQGVVHRVDLDVADRQVRARMQHEATRQALVSAGFREVGLDEAGDRVGVPPVDVELDVVVHGLEGVREHVRVPPAKRVLALPAPASAPVVASRPAAVESEGHDDGEKEDEGQRGQHHRELPPPRLRELVPPQRRQARAVRAVEPAAPPRPDARVLIPVQETQVLVLVIENVLVVVVQVSEPRLLAAREHSHVLPALGAVVRGSAPAPIQVVQFHVSRRGHDDGGAMDADGWRVLGGRRR